MATNKFIEDETAKLEGYLAFKRDGIRTVEDARLANPYKGFGLNKKEHFRYVSWNRGWNEAFKKSRE